MKFGDVGKVAMSVIELIGAAALGRIALPVDAGTHEYRLDAFHRLRVELGVEGDVTRAGKLWVDQLDEPVKFVLCRRPRRRMVGRRGRLTSSS